MTLHKQEDKGEIVAASRSEGAHTLRQKILVSAPQLTDTAPWRRLECQDHCQRGRAEPSSHGAKLVSASHESTFLRYWGESLIRSTIP